MKKTTLCFVLTFLVLTFGLTFNALAEEGVTDTEIHIGQWGPQTGPAAAWGAVARGTDAYFKMINDAGGIHGRKLVHHYFDDAYNPAKTMAGVKQLQENIGMFAWVSGVGTACGLAVKDYLMERKIPWFCPSAGSAHWVEPPQKYLFSVYPLYTGDAQLLTRYAVANLNLKRVAIVYQNDDYGKQGLVGSKKEMADHGKELVAEVPVAMTETDVKPHIMELRKAKADGVLLFVTPGILARLLGTGKAMQFEPQWMTTTTCADFPLMMAITKGLYAGTIAAGFGMMEPKDVGLGNIEDVMNPSHPLLKKYKKDAFEKYAAQGERWGLTFCAGIGYAEPLVEALRRVGRDLTREKLVAELENLKNFQGIMGRVSFKPFDPNDPLCRQGQSEIFLSQCTPEGNNLILTDWVKTDYISIKD